MSHSRGLKRKSNFLQAEGKTSAYARFMQELEEERQKKERLEWYLHEVMKEKEALSRFDDEASSSSSSSSVSAAVDAFLAQSSCASTSTSTTATSSSPSATTYASTSSAQSTAATSTTATEQLAANTNNNNDVNNNNNDEECCARCGRQYLESQKTCRCRNFESVKKRQRCLSRFVRTGHMLEVSEPVDELAELSVPFFDLNSFHFVEPTTTTTSTSTSAVDTSDNVSDEDFLRMILEDVAPAASMTKPEPASLGEKSQRRRRASFISTSSGWDSTSAAEEGHNYFAPASSTGLVFGY